MSEEENWPTVSVGTVLAACLLENIPSEPTPLSLWQAHQERVTHLQSYLTHYLQYLSTTDVPIQSPFKRLAFLLLEGSQHHKPPPASFWRALLATARVVMLRLSAFFLDARTDALLMHLRCFVPHWECLADLGAEPGHRFGGALPEREVALLKSFKEKAKLNETETWAWQKIMKRWFEPDQWVSRQTVRELLSAVAAAAAQT